MLVNFTNYSVPCLQTFKDYCCRVLSKMRRLKIYGISTDNKPVKLFTSYGGNFSKSTVFFISC